MIDSPSDTHLIDLDVPTWTEFIAWAEDVFSADFFVHYWQETTFEKLYSQLEFAKEYGNNLCTCYWPLTTLSIIMGRELTSDERLEMVKARYTSWDFDPAIWGFTSTGVDIVRRWYNAKHPIDPIRTAMVNDTALLHKLAQKNIPIVTSLRGNKEYTLDTKDGVMNKLDYWLHPWTRYGHCRTRRKLDVLDNYLRKYRYQTIDDLELCYNHAFESKNVFIFFKESSLSDLWKIYFNAMKKGYWNGERANDNITRFEASRIALKMNTAMKEKEIWNGKDGSRDASRYEVGIMLDRATWGRIKPDLSHNMNQSITRGEVIKIVMK